MTHTFEARNAALNRLMPVGRAFVISLLLFLIYARSKVLAPGTIALFALCASAVIPVLLVRWSRRLLGPLMFFLGLICFGFGVQSFQLRASIFELIVSIVTLALWSMPDTTANESRSSLAHVYLAFVWVCLTSLILVPASYYSDLLHVVYVIPVVDIISKATSASPFFSFQNALRLVEFSLFIWGVIRAGDSRKSFRLLGIGLVYGAIVATIVGILNYYRLIQLYDTLPSRLQSTFGHPGWYAEYVTVSIPYILFGFLKKWGRLWKFSLFAVLIICEVGLILAQARAGWIAYPATLLTCWLVFYLFTGESRPNTRKLITRTIISVPITIAISVSTLYGIDTVMSHHGSTEGRAVDARISARAKKIAQVSERFPQWRDGLAVAAEAPITGLGYGSYRWQSDILQTIKGSTLSEVNADHKKINVLPTPHNLYLSWIDEIGVVGLVIWLTAIFMAVMLLILDMVRNRHLENIAFLLSIISFHIYAFAQSMDYIPVVWFLIFIPLGYALTISTDVLRPVEKRWFDIARYLVVGLALVQSGQYLLNAGSVKLRERYHLASWMPRRTNRVNRFTQLGFAEQEKWPQMKIRWIGRNAILKTDKTGVLKFRAAINYPHISKANPVDLYIYVDGRYQSHHRYTSRGIYSFKVVGEPGVSPDTILFRTSRYFIPADSNKKSHDHRRLAIALTDPTTAFSAGTFPTGHDPEDGFFRWTRQSAVFTMALLERLPHPEIWANNPDIAAHPVHVDVFADGKHVAGITLKSHKRYALRALIDAHKHAEFLRLEVSRTWVPAKWSNSSDTRKLGIAITAPAPSRTGVIERH